MRAIAVPLYAVGHSIGAAAKQVLNKSAPKLHLKKCGTSITAPVYSQNEQEIGLLQKLQRTRHQHFELRGDTRQKRLAPAGIRHNSFVDYGYSRRY